MPILPSCGAHRAATRWPRCSAEADGTDARNALRRTLSVLRSGLGARGMVVDRSAVGLEEASVEVDLWRFRAALALARAHGHPAADPCPTCISALEEALAWDRGPFMEGFTLRDSENFDDWQAAEGEAHRRDLAGAFERLARARAGERRWDLAAETTRRWLAVDPLHEPAHQLMIASLARSGEVAAAVAAYRDLVRTLDRELGVSPLPETTDLAEAVKDGRLGPDHTSTELMPGLAETAPLPMELSLASSAVADAAKRALNSCPSSAATVTWRGSWPRSKGRA